MIDDFEIDWGSVCLVQPGSYEAVYMGHETFKGSFGPKLKIEFRIVTPGPYFESIVAGWYNLKATSEKPGKRGKAIASRHSKFTTEILRVLDVKQKPSRISPSQLKGKVLEITVRTVKTNSRQKTYSALQTYSVVDSINRLASDDRMGMVKSKIGSNKPLPKPIPEPIPTNKSIEAIAKKLPRKWRTCQVTNLALEDGM
jgi:hypothetical protein